MAKSRKEDTSREEDLGRRMGRVSSRGLYATTKGGESGVSALEESRRVDKSKMSWVIPTTKPSFRAGTVENMASLDELSSSAMTARRSGVSIEVNLVILLEVTGETAGRVRRII
ncbi:MAG: hypothetical protein OK454_08590 [Thaumarchaeota archaeon]|nr:hypothetical protein [Nitrososphaerota archaeon]